MLANIRTVIRPASVADAVRYLADGDGALRAIAGGTAHSLFRSREVTGLIDLWSLPLRRVVATAGELRLGATATLGDLTRSEAVRGWGGGALWEAARRAGSTLLRNLITVGGNVAALYPWSDLPPALLALDATVAIAGPAGPVRRFSELVERHPSALLGHESLITEVVVPGPEPAAGSAFLKLAESANAYSWLNVAALVELEDGCCARCRLAVGAVEARPRRLEAVEDRLVGEALDDDTLRVAGELAAEAVSPIPDPRTSADYRRELVQVQTRRALAAARDRAQAGGQR